MYNRLLDIQEETEELEEKREEEYQKCIAENPSLVGKMTSEFPHSFQMVTVQWYNRATAQSALESRIIKKLGQRALKFDEKRVLVPINFEGHHSLELMELLCDEETSSDH